MSAGIAFLFFSGGYLLAVSGYAERKSKARRRVYAALGVIDLAVASSHVFLGWPA